MSLTDLEWRASSFSNDGGDCVELAWPGTEAALRDSKNASGPALRVPAEAVAALVANVTRG
jgi:hypothetical protein